ncbi:MAG: hypothetical protein KAV18_03190 [Candidatus Omnitrophica bacterium]|nr:hypothetical protein [Candidatus Omnitrophota bacterium]
MKLLGLEIRKLARKKNERDNGRRGNIFGRGNSNKSRDVVDKTLLSSGRQAYSGLNTISRRINSGLILLTNKLR